MRLLEREILRIHYKKSPITAQEFGLLVDFYNITSAVRFTTHIIFTDAEGYDRFSITNRFGSPHHKDNGVPAISSGQHMSDGYSRTDLERVRRLIREQPWGRDF